MSNPVTEKEFVWKFVANVREGISNVQHAKDEVKSMINDIKSSKIDSIANASKINESVNEFSNAIHQTKEQVKTLATNVSENTDSITNKVNQSVSKQSDLAKEAINKIRSKNDEIRQIIEQTTTNFLHQLSKIPREKYTNLLAKIKSSNLGKFARKLRDVPKHKNVILELKDRFTNGFHKFNSDLQETNHHVMSFKDILAGTFLGGAILNGVYAIGNGIKGLIATGYQYDKEQQTMIASWHTLTNSASEGKKMVNMTNQLAISAQNATSMVNDLNQRFYAVTNNASKTRELSKSVLTLQDAFHASDAAIENFSTQWAQMVGNGKASAQDMLSIQNVFPKFRQELLKYEQQLHHSKNMTMADLNSMMSAGKISSSEMNTVLIKMGNEYKNATKNFTTTIDGMTRTIKATVPVLIGALIKPFTKTESPVYAAVSKWVTDGKTRTEFNKLGQISSQGMAKVVQAFSGGHAGTTQIEHELDGLVNNLGQKIKTLTNVIAKNAGNIKAIFSINGSIIKIFAKGAGAAIMDVVRVFGIFGSSAKSSASPLQILASLLKDVANNKVAIQMLGGVMLSVFTVNKYVAFLKWLRDLKKAMVFSTTLSVLKRMASSFGTLAATGIKALGGLISGTKELTVANGALDIVLSPWFLIPAAIAAVGIAFYEAYKHIKPFRDAVNRLGNSLKRFFTGKSSWNKAISKQFKDLNKAFARDGKAFQKKFQKWNKDLWNGLTGNAKWEKSIGKAFKRLGKEYDKYSKKQLKDEQRQQKRQQKEWNKFWNNFSKKSKQTWNSLKKYSSRGMENIRKTIAKRSRNISKTWNTSWSAIKQFSSRTWNNLKKHSSNGMNNIQRFISRGMNVVNRIWSSGWNTFANFFKSIWNGIKQAAQDGMNGVISVINAGIGAVNKVWSFFTGHGTGIGKLGKVHFAQGGTVHRHLSVINDGDGPDWKELVQTPDGQLFMSQERNWTGFLPEGSRVYNGQETRELMSMAGIDHYATGGIVGASHYAGGGVVGKAMDWAEGAFENVTSWLGDKFEAMIRFLEHPLEATKDLLQRATSGMYKGLGNFAQLGHGIMGKLTKPIADWFKRELDKLIAAMENGGVSSDLIRLAAAKMHVKVSSADIAHIMNVIQHESGGRAGAVNNWDSNAAKGTPSKGILQFIEPTFRSYAMPGYGDIMRPFDQLLAMFNDTTWRSDLTLGGWGPTGARRYATGGEVFGLTNAIIGDNPEHHEFVLNPYATSAEPLLDRAFEATAQAQPAGDSNGGNSKLDRMISLLEQLLTSVNGIDTDVYLDGEKITDNSNKRNALEYARMKRS